MLAKGKMCFGIKQSGCNKAAADKSLQSASIYAAISKKENNPTILEPRRIKRKSSGCGSRIHQQARGPVGRHVCSSLVYENRMIALHKIDAYLRGQRHGSANIKAIPW